MGQVVFFLTRKRGHLPFYADRFPAAFSLAFFSRRGSRCLSFLTSFPGLGVFGVLGAGGGAAAASTGTSGFSLDSLGAFAAFF